MGGEETKRDGEQREETIAEETRSRGEEDMTEMAEKRLSVRLKRPTNVTRVVPWSRL